MYLYAMNKFIVTGTKTRNGQKVNQMGFLWLVCNHFWAYNIVFKLQVERFIWGEIIFT